MFEHITRFYNCAHCFAHRSALCTITPFHLLTEWMRWVFLICSSFDCSTVMLMLLWHRILNRIRLMLFFVAMPSESEILLINRSPPPLLPSKWPNGYTKSINHTLFYFSAFHSNNNNLFWCLFSPFILLKCCNDRQVFMCYCNDPTNIYATDTLSKIEQKRNYTTI